MKRGLFYIACIINMYIGCILTAQIAAIPSAAAACPCQVQKQIAAETQKEDTDPGSPINTNSGKTFSITLDSNPTTGYQWQLTNPVDEKVLKLISSEYQAPEIKMMGAGGKEVWTFKTLSTGQITITFEYVRPWEKDREPVKKTTFTINIQ